MKANRNTGRWSEGEPAAPTLLRLWLKRHERTGASLADALGVTPGAVSMYLSGQRRPDPVRIIAIRNATGITPDAWLSGGELDECNAITQRVLHGE